MCLWIVIKEFEPNDNMMMCYKVYEYDKNNKLDVFVNEIYGERKKRLGRCYSSTINLRIGNMDKYESGYHCFINLKDARNWCINCCDDNRVIVKVLVWDIRTIGKQYNTNYGNTAVGKNIRLMEIVK